MNVLDKILKRESPTNSDNWQMFPGERLLLEKILERQEINFYLEIGVWYGGSLCLASKYCDKVVGIDIDKEVLSRFPMPSNGQVVIGNSSVELPRLLLSPVDAPDLILVDGDHSFQQVYSDISLIALHAKKRTVVLLHDTAHESVRNAIKKAFQDHSSIINLDLDLVPGRVIMNGGGKGEIWGGLGILEIEPNFKDIDELNRTIESTADESITRANAF
jgi:hypothetical protein